MLAYFLNNCRQELWLMFIQMELS